MIAAGVIVWLTVGEATPDKPPVAAEVKATCDTMVSVYLPDDDAMQVLAKQLVKDKRVDRLTTETKAQARARMAKDLPEYDAIYRPRTETPLAAAIHLVTARGVDSYQVTRELPNDYGEVAEAIAAECTRTRVGACFAIDYFGSEQDVKAVAKKLRADGRVEQVEVLTEQLTDFHLREFPDDATLAAVAKDPRGPFWMGRVHVRKAHYDRAMYQRVSRSGDVITLAYTCPPADSFEETSPAEHPCGNDAVAYFDDNAAMRAAAKKLRKDPAVVIAVLRPGIEGGSAEIYLTIKPGKTGYLERQRLESELEDAYLGPMRCLGLPHPSLPR